MVSGDINMSNLDGKFVNGRYIYGKDDYLNYFKHASIEYYINEQLVPELNRNFKILGNKIAELDARLKKLGV